MSMTALINHLYAAWQRGPVSEVRLGSQRAVLVTGPEEVRRVLVQDAAYYTKQAHRARSLLGDGLIVATGDAWKRQRRTLQPHFTAPAVRRYERHISDAAQRLARRWDALADTGEPTDIGEDMRFFALDTIWRLLTGTPLDAHTHRELAAIDTVVAALPTMGSTPRDGSGSMDGSGGSGGSGDPDIGGCDEQAAALARIDAVASRAVAAAREAAPAAKTGILHSLVDLPDQLLRDELVTLIVAGHETTATTLSWLHLLLHRHPRWREWALREGAAGYQALIGEALRLYPSVWLVPRHAAVATELGGQAIEAGTRVLVCPYLTQRDPAWWPAPTSFDPRRFAAKPRPGTYHPFGVGPRACLGQHFSLREMQVLLEALLPHHVPRFTGPQPAPAFAVTLRPEGPLTATLHRP
ncbi:cytochrome P450 [Streptomyces sp. NBC_01775]|uniref:cytochrome P450 n=1 Tax=Streptomyces sp. NBC_01775 TaxID=2975939 RepID=UPI002DDB6F0A|nr:cytochrome P450 [Streptomyces sp. NBC_01775]WSB78177.1 cytochrome P450 [Streptomyces sp. NBC_01775]